MLHEALTDPRRCVDIEEWFEENVGSLHDELTQRLVRKVVPLRPLEVHAEFGLISGYPFSFHNHNHVWGVIAVAMSYLAHCSEKDDPLMIWEGVRALEKEWGGELTRDEVKQGVAIGLGWHDVCEIATGYCWDKRGNFEIKFRTDGYRARRSLPGYSIPEEMSAEIASIHAQELYPDNPLVARLARIVALETTWSSPSYKPLGAFTRFCDRASGLFNPDPHKDWGMLYELYMVDPGQKVCLHTEFNFPQTMAPKVLPLGVNITDVLNVVYSGNVPPDVTRLNDAYQDLPDMKVCDAIRYLNESCRDQNK